MDTAAAEGRSPGTTPDPTTHRVWPRFLVIVLSLAGLVIALQFVQGLQAIVGPVFLGLNLVIIAYPLQAWLIRQGVHRFLGATVTVVVVVVLLLVFMALILWSASELVMALPQYGQQFNEIYNSMITWVGSFGVTPDMMLEQLSGLNMSTVVSTATGIVTALLSNVTAILGLLATVVMTVFFLAMDSVAVDRRMALLNRAKFELGTALTAFADGVRRYWVVTTIFGLIVAVLDVAALAIIGVPMIWVWGVLSFLTNYIPNVGFIIGMVPPALLGLVEGGWGAFFGVVAAYSVLNFVIQAIIQPKFTGESVGVIPTVSFLSLLFWAWILGPLGAILALPATLLLKAIMIDADPQSRWINSFVASDLKGMESRDRRPRSTTAAPDGSAEALAGAGETEAGPEEWATDGSGVPGSSEATETVQAEPAGRRRESDEAQGFSASRVTGRPQ